MRSIVHNGRDKQSNGDGPLVSSDDSTSNPLGGRFGLIQRNCKYIVSMSIWSFSGFVHLLSAEIKPTPNPAKKRPARKRGTDVDAT